MPRLRSPLSSAPSTPTAASSTQNADRPISDMFRTSLFSARERVNAAMNGLVEPSFYYDFAVLLSKRGRSVASAAEVQSTDLGTSLSILARQGENQETRRHEGSFSVILTPSYCTSKGEEVELREVEVVFDLPDEDDDSPLNVRRVQGWGKTREEKEEADDDTPRQSFDGKVPLSECELAEEA